ncbi:MAG: hypothetical protein WKF59_10415, partial [Chitinophagaceae bacterium]
KLINRLIMKTINKHSILKPDFMNSINTQSISLRLTLLSLIFFVLSCKKGDQQPDDPSPKADTYPADVVLKWLDMKSRLIQQGGTNFKGLALPINTKIDILPMQELSCMNRSYQACLNTSHSQAQLTDMPQMPPTEPGKTYH